VATDPRSDALNKYYGLGKYAPTAKSPVPGYTNDSLQDALNQSIADNPQSGGLGPAPSVDYTSGAPTAGGAVDAPVDWSSYLGLYGLPPDVQKELNAIFQRTPDVNQATQLALAYVRGTPWYATTYPGINEAIAKGIVRDEAGYRAAQNGYNQVFRQYNNRDMTAAEFAGYLGEGVSADTVAKRFQGASIASVYGNDWQYAAGNFGEGKLGADELQAAGRQEAGLDSELGMRVQRRLQQAQDRIRAVFSGSLATSKLAQPLGEQSGIPSDIGR
jgi:hypothetical protein